MLSNETKINEIHFNTKYISGHALKVLTDFTNNSYIIKGSTGIGGTTALLNYTKGHCLIISPNVGMIKSKAKGKEQKLYSSNNQFFLYSDSADKWNDVNDYLSCGNNAIISTTPDQIIKIKNTNKELYSRLIEIPIFIDENHSFIVDSDYRKIVGEFLELVYNEWSANFKLSTATPNYNFLDVPKDKDVKYYKLIRANQPTKKIQVSNCKKDVKQYIQSEHLKGRLVVVFTNNIDYHKSLTNLRVKNLVGQTLDTKLKPFERGLTDIKDLYKDTDVIFLSSSYIAGFDIDKDCSICIVSEQSNEAYKININNVVQAFGRCRKNVQNALFVNVLSKTTAKKIDGQNVIVTNQPITKTDIENKINGYDSSITYYQTKINDSEWHKQQHTDKEITRHNHVNRAVILKPILSTIYDYQLYNETALNEALEGYGFEVSKYVNEDDNIIIPKGVKLKFEDRINNLLKLDETVLIQSYYNIKRNLKFKGKGNFSVKLAFEYLSTYLLLKSDAKQIIKTLENKRVKPNEFYNSMDLFFRANIDTKYYQTQVTPNQLKKVNDTIENDIIKELKPLTDDWQMLYACHRVTNNILPGNIEREIQLYDLFYDVGLYHKYNGNKNRIRNTVKAILKRCIDLSITLSDSECVWLKDVIKSIFKALDNNEQFTHNNSRKNIKSKMTNALLYLLTNGKITPSLVSKNRAYNPLTQLPTNMRSIIPIKYVSVDLSSANPQICDSILGTAKGLNVYQSLMTNRAISRPQAKKLFNSTLNNHYLTVTKAKKVYLDSGFNDVKALELAKLTAGVQKGAFYELMTANEKMLMQNYRNILTIKNYRFHDALIIKYEDVEINNITLPTIVQGYKYHVEIFNDSSDYNGRLTDVENNGHAIDNRYYL